MRSPTLLPFAAALAVTAQAADKTPRYDPGLASLGAATFKANCAACHGPSGKGDGPLAPGQPIAPVDLTRIARRSRGEFSFDKVAKIIDGREAVKGHGGSGMPAWGDTFLQSHEGYDAAKVKEKIKQLVHYLASIQETDAKQP